jgi:hypothetical protein
MSTAKFDTLSTLDGSYSVPVSTVAQGTARAWVNFNGTGTVAIRASFNVSSITDNGTGNFTMNFTAAMPDANYSVAGANGTSTQTGIKPRVFNTGSLRFETPLTNGVLFDDEFNSVQIFR